MGSLGFHPDDAAADCALVRYLIIKSCLSVAIRLIFGACMFAGDVGGIASLIGEQPGGLLILLMRAVLAAGLRNGIGVPAFGRCQWKNSFPG